MVLKVQKYLMYALIKASKAFNNQLGMRLAKLELQPGQDALLVWIKEQKNPSQAELCKEIGVESATIAKAIRRLEQRGLIFRKPDKHDKRVSRIMLTAKARKLIPKIQVIWNDLENQARFGFEKDDAENLRSGLLTIRDNLKDEPRS
jgi:DNA-binding MarR family transcriptional regulator